MAGEMKEPSAGASNDEAPKIPKEGASSGEAPMVREKKIPNAGALNAEAPMADAGALSAETIAGIMKPSGSKKPMVLAIEEQIRMRKGQYDGAAAADKGRLADDLRKLDKARTSALGSSATIADEE